MISDVPAAFWVVLLWNPIARIKKGEDSCGTHLVQSHSQLILSEIFGDKMKQFCIPTRLTAVMYNYNQQKQWHIRICKRDKLVHLILPFGLFSITFWKWKVWISSADLYPVKSQSKEYVDVNQRSSLNGFLSDSRHSCFHDAITAINWSCLSFKVTNLRSSQKAPQPAPLLTCKQPLSQRKS